MVRMLLCRISRSSIFAIFLPVATSQKWPTSWSHAAASTLPSAEKDSWMGAFLSPASLRVCSAEAVSHRRMVRSK